jgi:hypothetical protein
MHANLGFVGQNDVVLKARAWHFKTGHGLNPAERIFHIALCFSSFLHHFMSWLHISISIFLNFINSQ